MQQSKPLERREEALELARRSCWDNVVRGRFKYLRVSVREGRVRVSCPARVSQRALTRFIEENLEKVAFWMCTQKAQLESRRNDNPLSAHLCDGGRVAYEGKVFRLRCDPNIARTQQSALTDELLVRAEATASVEKIAAVVQKWLKERFAERLSERVFFGRTRRVCIRRKSVSAMPKSSGAAARDKVRYGFLGVWSVYPRRRWTMSLCTSLSTCGISIILPPFGMMCRPFTRKRRRCVGI